MINDKEIDIAARAQALSKHINETAYFHLRSIEDFKDGAHWAINEFLKDLWYPANEEPKHDKQITYVWLNGIAKTIILNEEADKFNRTPSQIWHNICKNYKVARWLYIDDLLLPKKGGEE